MSRTTSTQAPMERKTEFSGMSFIGLNIPFIGCNRPHKRPFVGLNLPFSPIRSKQEGFTLIELMVAILILSVLLGFGIPSFKNSMKNNRMVTVTNDMYTDLMFARSEALKRSRDVHVCKSTNPLDNNPQCDNATAWKNGWIVWVDGTYNTDGSTRTPINGLLDNGEVLRVNEGTVDYNINITASEIVPGSSINNEIIFTRLGLLSNEGGKLTLCDDRGAASGREIELKITGRPVIQRNTKSYTITC